MQLYGKYLYGLSAAALYHRHCVISQYAVKETNLQIVANWPIEKGSHHIESNQEVQSQLSILTISPVPSYDVQKQLIWLWVGFLPRQLTIHH